MSHVRPFSKQMCYCPNSRNSQSMDGNNGITGLLEQVNLAFGLLSGAITLFNFVQGTVL